METRPTSETALVARIRRRILVSFPDAWIFKVMGNPMQTVGVPDLLICIDGLLVGMEVKWIHPGETRAHAAARATATQRAQIARINRSGGIAAVVTSVDEAMDLIARGFQKRHRREKERSAARNHQP